MTHHTFFAAVRGYLEEKGMELGSSYYLGGGTGGVIKLQAVQKAIFYELLLPEVTRLAWKYRQMFRYVWVGVPRVLNMESDAYANMELHFGNSYPGGIDIHEVSEVVRKEDL